MLFTVWVGMRLAAPGVLPWRLWLATPLGIALVAASAAALNHLVDRHVDVQMARTRHRPLPQGDLRPAQVIAFAIVTGAAGLALLLAFANALCTALTVASLLGYALVYSVLLKHRTPQNIVIGGAAGAAPPLLGWTAVTGQVDPGGLLLFLIIFLWTPPHFWALAIDRRDDYARAGVPMLPVTHGIRHTADRIVGYTWALLGVSLLPVAIGMSGAPYGAAALGLGLGFVVHAVRLRRAPQRARATFRYSIVYLSLLFSALLADRLLS